MCSQIVSRTKAPSHPASAHVPSEAIAALTKVMVVDDSVVIRGLLSRWIDAERDLAVVASVRTGQDAVSQLKHADPDIVILDIEMPVLDGIAALPMLLAQKPGLIVIMASTLTRKHAEISFRALALGASDYIPKPESSRDIDAVEVFRRDLIGKIRSLSSKKSANHNRNLTASSDASAQLAQPHVPPSQPFTLRPFSATPPQVLLVGASTGGPQALMTLLAGLGEVIDHVPVLITQHMPPLFTTILAERLMRICGRPTAEAIDGEEALPGKIYLAPGQFHMRVRRQGGTVVLSVDDDKAINFCKPAIDPMFQTAAEIWKAATLAVVLTGMGADGMLGGRTIIHTGGSVIAQDEASSVVWGMPGAVAQDGQCAAVLPLDAIAPRLIHIFARQRLNGRQTEPRP